jgi:hypothetical protein
VRPEYRENYNNKRREKALEKLKNPIPPTADQIAARKAFNLKVKNKYNSLPLEERTRKMTALQKLNKRQGVKYYFNRGNCRLCSHYWMRWKRIKIEFIFKISHSERYCPPLTQT